jgi:hypothetical protein
LALIFEMYVYFIPSVDFSLFQDDQDAEGGGAVGGGMIVVGSSGRAARIRLALIFFDLCTCDFIPRCVVNVVSLGTGTGYGSRPDFRWGGARS